jgi:hypothetical protein
MAKLAELGFSKNVITEAIVSTYNMDGQPNAAPMGVTLESARSIAIRPYVSTQTSENLQLKKCAVINVTSNPEIFYRTAFKEANPEGRIPLGWFQRAETVDAPRMRMADATIEVELRDAREIDEERINALCQVKLIRASKVLPQVYCRALYAVIESVVHATRIKVLIGDDSEQERVNRLVDTINENSCLVKRVAPTSLYSEIIDDLNRRIESWRVKSENPR